MRDEFEQHAGDVLQLSSLHSTAAVFHWTREQEAAAQAAAAAADQADKAVLKQQQRLASIQQQQKQQWEQQVGSDGQQQQPQHHAADYKTAPNTGTDVEQAEADQEVLSTAVATTSDEEQSEANSDDDVFVSKWAAGGWLVDNPLGVPTEREHYVQAQGGKVFRVLVVKK